MPNMVELIKRAAKEGHEASKPIAAIFGTVTSASPLRISTEQKLILESEQLVLTQTVTDYTTSATLGGSTSEADGHVHSLGGIREAGIHNGLKRGDIVVLLRVDGGQQYIVLDRVVSL